jgi:endoplasmic reticulum junction formation protein lunapark
MGTDSGFKVSLGDESKTDTVAKSKDVKLAHEDGLRHKKQPQLSGEEVNKGNLVTQITKEASSESVAGAEAETEGSTPKVVEHYTGPGLNEGGWIGRLAKLLGSKDLTQCPALICGNCHMHNGKFTPLGFILCQVVMLEIPKFHPLVN